MRSSPRTKFCLLRHVSRPITFPPTSWLLLPWQASPPGKCRGDAANPVISRLGRLRTSEILIPLLVSSAVKHDCHHRPALPFRSCHPFRKQVLILTEEISSTFVPRCFPILYPISRSGTKISKSPPPSGIVPHEGALKRHFREIPDPDRITVLPTASRGGAGGKPTIVVKHDPSVSNSAWKAFFR